jgi:hypothetical protein
MPSVHHSKHLEFVRNFKLLVHVCYKRHTMSIPSDSAYELCASRYPMAAMFCSVLRCPTNCTLIPSHTVAMLMYNDEKQLP